MKPKLRYMFKPSLFMSKGAVINDYGEVVQGGLGPSTG